MQELISLKDKGNKFFKEAKYNQSIVIFNEITQKVQSMQDKQYLNASTQVSKLYVNVLNNSALASLNMKTQQSYTNAEKYATNALSVDKDNLKGLYRRGLAYKQKAQLIQRQRGEQSEGLIELYQRAKADFERLNILDRTNDLALKKFQETVKDIYRVTTAKGKQIKFTRDGNETSKEVKKKESNPYQATKPVRKQKDMEKIMKQYKVEQVTNLVQTKIQQQYLKNDLPGSLSEFQKAVRTIQKSDQIFIAFIYRLNGEYLQKINPSFDLLAQLITTVLTKSKSQDKRRGQFFLICKDLKSFDLFWKSLISKQKKQFKQKWVEFGLKEEDISHLK